MIKLTFFIQKYSMISNEYIDNPKLVGKVIPKIIHSDVSFTFATELLKASTTSVSFVTSALTATVLEYFSEKSR